MMGNCWSWDQYVDMLSTLKAAYDAGNLPPVIVGSMTMLAGYFGVAGGSD